jgi:hypothetical protein
VIYATTKRISAMPILMIGLSIVLSGCAVKEPITQPAIESPLPATTADMPIEITAEPTLSQGPTVTPEAAPIPTP